MPEPIVALNGETLRTDLHELVRRTVEEMPDGMLDEEADGQVGAERYERTADREAYRAGHCERKLTTTSGEVTIRMPKLKGMLLTTAIIERRQRRETSVEEAMIETCLADVSTGRIEDVSEILWGLERLGVDGVEPERQGLRGRGGLEEQVPRVRLLLRLRRLDIPQEIQRRELGERGRDGGHRRERRRLSRGHRHCRGLHGVLRVLTRVPPVAEVARTARG